MRQISIRRGTIKDIKEVSKILQKCVDVHLASELSAVAAIDLKQSIPNDESVAKKRIANKLFLVAVRNKKITGYLLAKENRLINLFTWPIQTGAGSALMHKYLQIQRKSGTGAVYVRASIFACPFYEKFGFKKTTGTRERHGILCQPMKYPLK